MDEGISPTSHARQAAAQLSSCTLVHKTSRSDKHLQMLQAHSMPFRVGFERESSQNSGAQVSRDHGKGRTSSLVLLSLSAVDSWVAC